MDLLELASKYTELKRVTANEYHGPCPSCGGSDRFIVKIDTDRYWCRGCDLKGDLIQFLRDFENMSYPEAAKATGNHAKLTALPDRPKIEPVKPAKASDNIDRQTWSDQARKTAIWCHKQLIKRPALLDWLESERGISRFTVDKFLIGFNPESKKSPGNLWGLSEPVYLAKGITIPHIQINGLITGFKTRQFKSSDNAPVIVTTEPKQRYINVRGGGGTPWLLSNHHAPIMVVESELDALLLWQELDLFVGPLAMLTASAKPDPRAKTGTILYSMDFDQAGINSFGTWHSQNPLTLPYPPVKGKDISEMVKAGVNLFDWLKMHFEQSPIPLKALNPYAHFTLKTGANWSEQGTLPDHLYQSCFDVVTRWQMKCDDLAGAQAIQNEYFKLWGN